MKVKVRILMFLILIATSFSGCKALDSLLPKDYNNDIAIQKIEGRYVFQVNYDPHYTKYVYLDNVKIKPGVKYYVKEGKYWFRYVEEEKYRLSLLFTRNSSNDEEDFDGMRENPETVRRVIMNEDKVINITGKKCKIEFQIGTGWD